MVVIDKMLHAFLNNIPKNGGEEDSNPRPTTKDEHVLAPHHGCVCDFFWHVSLYMFGPIIWHSKPKKYGLGCTLAPSPSRPAGASCKLEPICQGNWRENGKKICCPRELNPRPRTKAKRTVPPHHFIVCDLLRHTLFLTCQWENREIKSKKIIP